MMKVGNVKDYELLCRLTTEASAGVFGEVWKARVKVDGKCGLNSSTRFACVRVLAFDPVNSGDTDTEYAAAVLQILSKAVGGYDGIAGVCAPSAIACCELTRTGWIIYPYLPHSSLSEWRRREHTLQFTECVIAAMLKQVLAAVGAMHARGKWHGHIKAGNVLLSAGGEITICDAGLALLEDTLVNPVPSPVRLSRCSKHGGSLAAPARETRRRPAKSAYSNGRPAPNGGPAAGPVKTVVETSPHWLAPEAIAAGSMAATPHPIQADVWSIGILAYELATRNTPVETSVPAQRAADAIVGRGGGDVTGGAIEAALPLFQKDFTDFLAQCLQRDALVRPTCQMLLRDAALITKSSRPPMPLRLAQVVGDPPPAKQDGRGKHNVRKDKDTSRAGLGATSSAKEPVRDFPDPPLVSIGRLADSTKSVHLHMHSRGGDAARDDVQAREGSAGDETRSSRIVPKLHLSMVDAGFDLPRERGGAEKGGGGGDRSNHSSVNDDASFGGSRPCSARDRSLAVPVPPRGGGGEMQPFGLCKSSFSASPRDAIPMDRRPPKASQPDYAESQLSSTPPHDSYLYTFSSSLPRCGSYQSQPRSPLRCHSKSSSPVENGRAAATPTHDLERIESTDAKDKDLLMLRTVLAPSLDAVLDDVPASTARQLFEIIGELQDVLTIVGHKCAESHHHLVRDIMQHVESSHIPALRSLSSPPPFYPSEGTDSPFCSLNVDHTRSYLARKFLSKYTPVFGHD